MSRKNQCKTINRKELREAMEELEQYLKAKIEEVKKIRKKRKKLEKLGEGLRPCVETYLYNIIEESNKDTKSFISATVTLLLVKHKFPKHDLNKHTAKLGGISFRTIDTKVTVPILRKYFPAYVNTATAWLTPTFRGQEPLSEAVRKKTKSKKVKDSFLCFLETINKNPEVVEKVLLYLLCRLLKKQEQHKKGVEKNRKNIQLLLENKPPLTINKTIDILEKFLHLSQEKKLYTARLPVLMLYSIYNLLVSQHIGVYSGKHLAPIKHHTTSDVKEGYGDIEVYDGDNIFEAVEVKHNIAINPDIVVTKIYQVSDTPIKRYLFLTTAEPYIEKGYEEEIRKLIEEVKQDKGIEVIVNGVLHTIKYYLRILGDPLKFMKLLMKILYEENKKNAFTVREEHIKMLHALLSEAIKY